ncbi:hypothetical protein AAFF_G00199010 [Aldrovandia affinis]|uniref:Uncharacterized protein n=1 Tax=Aldrovandia affinis TaxID=143900 RepID=A0AAD7RIG1_9TELE|nr:hypothetical protein AAFF_G00199010 [Aldrovandia affinis]
MAVRAHCVLTALWEEVGRIGRAHGRSYRGPKRWGRRERGGDVAENRAETNQKDPLAPSARERMIRRSLPMLVPVLAVLEDSLLKVVSGVVPR